MSEDVKFRWLLVLLAACFIVVGLIDDPDAYQEDRRPGLDAPVYVNWRTGELVDPRVDNRP